MVSELRSSGADYPRGCLNRWDREKGNNLGFSDRVLRMVPATCDEILMGHMVPKGARAYLTVRDPNEPARSMTEYGDASPPGRS